MRSDVPLKVLLVEDDDVEVMSIERAFRRCQVDVKMTAARDGVEALDTLRGTGGRERLTKPHLVILDLNMPRMSGLEFLEILRSDEDLRKTVVFVLTTSDHEADRSACYDHCVAGYIVKQHLEFQNLAQLLAEYWQLVDLPEN